MEKPKPSIGIGISTTPNRDIIGSTLDEFQKYPGPNSSLIVYTDALYHGVAATKNKLLARLDKFDHIFLFDDDTYPIADEWWKPYIESEEPHLMYQFRLPNKPQTDMQEVYRDDKIVAYTHTRGCMIYIKKYVLEVVGGFDEAYGQAMFEHPDFTNRIHNAGLTSYRAMDVPNSDKLLYCLDQDSQIESSISDHVRGIGIRNNYKLYQKSKKSREYKDYK